MLLKTEKDKKMVDSKAKKEKEKEMDHLPKLVTNNISFIKPKSK
jgi:hypothetical protein